MPVPKQLSPDQAARTLLGRLGKRGAGPGLVDRIRQIATRLGDRPYCVDLVWVKWSGGAIGEGTAKELARLPLVPNPVVSDLTGVALNPYSAGVLPVGTLRLTEVSAGLREDVVRCQALPDSSPRPDDVEAFYEVRPDGREGGPAVRRQRYRLLGEPFLDADRVQWVVLLERASEDPSRQGTGLPALPGGT